MTTWFITVAKRWEDRRPARSGRLMVGEPSDGRIGTGANPCAVPTWHKVRTRTRPARTTCGGGRRFHERQIHMTYDVSEHTLGCGCPVVK